LWANVRQTGNRLNSRQQGDNRPICVCGNNCKSPDLKAGGRVVSLVSPEPPPQRSDVQVRFFYAEVTTSRLEILNALFENGTISARVGSILPLAKAREAHLMLAGAPHRPGKIVLQLS